jgi:uncharacterized protein
MKTNQEIVLELYKAFAQGNLQYIAEKMAPQFIASQTTELPWGGAYTGLAEYQIFTQKLRKFVDSRVTLEETFEAGDRAVAIARTKGQVIQTGEPFDIRVVHLWTLSEGLVTRFEAYIDTPAMLQALEQKTASSLS